MRQRGTRAALRTLLPVFLAVILAGLLPGQARGALAPGFTLELLDGKGTVSLADLKGSPVVLLFWTPWCDMCNYEAPGWERVYEQSKQTDVKIIGIGLEGTRQECQAFVRRHHLTFPNAYDPDGDVARRYGFSYQPYRAVIAKDGTLLRAGFSPASEREFASTIKALAGR